jgi:hypothetical protein
MSFRRRPGLRVPRLPPRIYLLQPQVGHPRAQGPRRPARRRAALHHERRDLDPRPAAARIWRRPFESPLGARRTEEAGRARQPDGGAAAQAPDIEINRSGDSLSKLLADGEIDAVISSRPVDAIGSNPDIARLFPNYREVEKDYYRRTRIFPIMHLIVIRRDVHEANPFVAQSLYDALCDSKDRALALMKERGALRYMLPWLPADMDEIDDVFGGDPWPYGVEANRPTLEALVQYMVEQHFIPRRIPIEELFVVGR